MRKYLTTKTLRPHPGPRRLAFSLAELVISIAILLLMLSLAGQVFNITVQSTGQATALTRLNQDLRVLEQNLREDLRYVQPGQSVILIQGNPVNAYWSQKGRESDDNAEPGDWYSHAGDPEREDPTDTVNTPRRLEKPRADILMFFTARRGASYANPSITSNLQQVVYAHAEMVDYSPINSPARSCEDYDAPPPPINLVAFPLEANGYPDPDTASAIPSESWHLARRSVLILQNEIPNDPLRGVTDNLDASKSAGSLDQLDLLRGKGDTIWNFNFEQLVLRGGFRTGNQQVDCDSAPWFLPNIFAHSGRVTNPYLRSQMDPAPPALCSDRLGHYFQPGCASFKVEWCLNPASEFVAGRLDGIDEVFWFDAGGVFDSGSGPTVQPLRSLHARVEELKTKTDAVSKDRYKRLRSLLCDSVAHADGYLPGYSLADRFDPPLAKSYCTEGLPDAPWDILSGVPTNPNLIVFNATRPVMDSTGNCVVPNRFVPDDMFPAALRITVDMMDRERRLDRPLRHVMVIPVG